MKKILIQIEANIVRLEEALLFAVLALLVITLSVQVATRFLLEFPLGWTEELGRVLQIWLVFIGAAVGTRRCEHFVVDLFMDKATFPGKQIVARSVDILVVAFFCLLTWIGVQVTVHGAGQILPTMGVSIAWAYAAIPVGCVLMAFHFVLAWIRPQESRDSIGEGAE